MLESVQLFLIIALFLYLLICAMSYMLYQVYKQKRFNHKVNEIEQTFGIKIQAHLEQIEKAAPLDRLEVENIKEVLKKPVYQTVFNQTLLNFKAVHPQTLAVTQYIQHYPEYINKMMKQRTHNAIEQTYKAFLIGQYGYRTPESLEYLYRCLGKDSIYVRLHTLEALKKLGDTPYFFKALNYLSQEDIYIYPKAIIEVMDSFQGDSQALNQLLISSFQKLNETLQICCIEHWKNKSDEAVASHLFEWIQDETQALEVKLSLIKYFTQVKYEPCKNTLQQLMYTDYWEVRALTAKALVNYPCTDTTQALLAGIKDKNWYVRNNSANSLIQFEDIKEIGKRIIGQKDLYAEEAFFYALFQNHYITYQDYLGYQADYKFGEIIRERKNS